MMKTLKQIVSKAPSVILTTSLFLLASVLAGRTQTFNKITTGPVVTDVDESVGCAWVDYDDDGFLDLFVTNFGGNSANRLYHNNGNGTFTRFNAGAPANELASTAHGCAWGDYDNDGFLDLLVLNLGTTNWFYHNNGNGTFQKMSGSQAGDIAAGPPSHSVSAAWADFDGDGYLDLFVANGALFTNMVDALYRNLGQGRFTNVAPASGITQALESTSGTWADVDGDGRLDLFVTHSGNQGNYIYRNLGDGTFQVISNGNVLNERLNSVGSAWGDYDNDGLLDLFVVNRTLSGPLQRNVLYRNKGGGMFDKITAGDIVNDVGVFNSCAWIDYDNDGYLDLFVTNEGLKNRLYHNNGDGTFTSITEGEIVTDLANSTGFCWGDYDNDGFLDLFVANGGITAPQRNFLYHNNTNSNHWIKIRCVGTVSNRSAIGTIVRAKAFYDGADRSQMRQISGGDGWLSQNSLDVSIGFGAATNIELLHIEWPSGIVQEFQNVAVDQTLIIEEPSLIQSATLVGGGLEIVLKGGGRDAKGQPRSYGIETSADLIGWSVLTNIVVTNADGTATLRDSSPGATNRFYRARRSVSK
jgi:hypothetical protein